MQVDASRGKTFVEAPLGGKIMLLQGKNAVVVGGASGIGAGISRSLAKRGAAVDICDVDVDGAASLAAELRAGGADVASHRLDVVDEVAIIRLEQELRAARHRIDLLFANAGAVCLKPFGEAETADWEWLFNINLFGCVRTIRSFLPGMLRQESPATIAVTSSVTALRTPAMPGLSLYTATKAAQFGLVRGLQTELAGTNVGICAIFPGPVTTPIREKSEAQRPGAAGPPVSAAATETGSISAEEAGERIVVGIERGQTAISTHPAEIELVELEQAGLIRSLRS